MKANLTEEDRVRYARQMMIPDWGESGQVRLKNATVLIVGAGGLGSPAALYMAAAGVGNLRICDRDVVELSNLNRQILHPQARLGTLKANSAKTSLQDLNPNITIEPVAGKLTADTVSEFAKGVDLIMDCLDNFPARMVLNRYSVQHQIPLMHAAVSGMYGQVSFFQPPETGCLRCLVQSKPAPKVEPALGAMCGVVGSLQALEAIKFLLGMKDLLKNKLLVVDGNDLSFDILELGRNQQCEDCG